MRQLLRQGRGAGFLAALDAGERAADDVLHCVLNDPRWDRQVEARDDYYAQLLLATRADIEVLRQRIVQEEGRVKERDVWLPIGVLAEMCRRGQPFARRALAEGVAIGAGWRACLDTLDAVGGRGLIEEVVSVASVEALVARVGIDDIADAVSVVAAPWKEWAKRVPALRFAVMNGPGSDRDPTMSGPMSWAAARMRAPARASLTSLTLLSSESLLAQASRRGPVSNISKELARRTDAKTLRLLTHAAESGSADERYVALGALGIRGSTEFVAAAEAFLRRESVHGLERRAHRLRRGYVRYLEELSPTRTLPLARQWFSEPWPLSLAAEHILARHATPDDRPMLERAGADALVSTDMVRLCAIVDAIGTAGPEGSLRFLGEVYQHAPYSYARERVVNAMNQCRLAALAEGYLTEALWDCEAGSRGLACRATLPGEPARRRIEELARDAYEDGWVREAAQPVLGEQ